MDAEFLKQTESVYHAVLEVEESRRAIFLREICGSDTALLHEVESLLGYGERAEDFLEAPAVELAGLSLALDEARPPTSVPVSIGSYRILRLLGEGGMGAVYEAEQEHPRRLVALKIIRPGLATPELLRRFEQEAQSLARLQHPGIAQIYEAGTANIGFGPQPWFAMELIRGQSLLQYAETRQLKTRQRLELMAKVCEAVHHAHQRGIIHRDLKPGNIPVDESGQPKILDFGVARVTDGDAQATRQTEVGQIIGTLAYMSPEQVLADPLEMDTRSDVYALGVILYELLSGRLPYKISGQLHEAAQTIREADPASLSSISRVYRGDIETIVAKALEKDKSRRYASAAGMAGDLRRYLDDEPIIARPPSATYQLQKFARRHKALVAGVAAVFVVLIAGIVASTWEAARARRAEQVATTERNRAIAERQRADAESAVARAVNEFLLYDLLAQAGPDAQAGREVRPDPDLKVRTALDRAAATVARRFNARPLIEASIRRTIGNAYKQLGLYPEAQIQLERALELQNQFLGEEHVETLGTMYDLAHNLFRYQGKYEQAEPLLIKVLDARRRTLGEHAPSTLEAMNKLGDLYRFEGRAALAEPLLTKALDGCRRVLGERSSLTLDTENNLALVYRSQGRYKEAASLLTSALDGFRSPLSKDYPETLIISDNLAGVYIAEGMYTRAELLFENVLASRQRVLGVDHPDTWQTMSSLAGLYRREGKYARAEPLYRKILEARRRVLGEENAATLNSTQALASVYAEERMYAEAEPLYTQVLNLRKQILGEENLATRSAAYALATLYFEEGKYRQAEQLSLNALKVGSRVLGLQHPINARERGLLGELRLKQQRYAEAEALFREALSLFGRMTVSDPWSRYSWESSLGVSLAGQKKNLEAETLLLSAYAFMKQQGIRQQALPPSFRFQLEQAGKRIIQFYDDQGLPDKAAEWQARISGGEVRHQRIVRK